MLDWHPWTPHARRIWGTVMGIPCIWHAQEEWNSSICGQLPLHQSELGSPRVSSLDYRRDTEIGQRLSLLDKHWPEYGISINPTKQQGKEDLHHHHALWCLQMPYITYGSDASIWLISIPNGPHVCRHKQGIVHFCTLTTSSISWGQRLRNTSRFLMRL